MGWLGAKIILLNCYKSLQINRTLFQGVTVLSPQGARPEPVMTNCPTIATALNESLAGPISSLTRFPLTLAHRSRVAGSAA